VNFQNDFTTGDNRYTNNRQQTLHLLDKYSKTVVERLIPSEGTSFAQKSGRGSGNLGSNVNGKDHDYSTYDKKLLVGQGMLQVPQERATRKTLPQEAK
jgi:hypothetical protein